MIHKFRSELVGNKWLRYITCFVLILGLLSSSISMTWAMSNASSNEAVVNNMGPSVELVKNGKANATIILSPSATDGEREAAEVLKDYIQKISGAVLPVTNSTEGTSGIRIYMGAAADLSLEEIKAGGDQPESFRLNVTEDAIALVGLTDTGTRYAAYELLEQLGVRWFMPGDIGTVIPTLTTVNINIQDTIQHPGYKTRFLQALSNYASHATIPLVYNPTEAKEWETLNRLGGKTFGGHGFPGKETYKTKPEWCYVEDGKPTIQFDVSKPEVLEYTVAECLKLLEANPELEYINISPNDGQGFGGKIEGWDADDFDPMGGKLSITDRYVKFYNLVIDRLEKAGYDKVGIAFYAYSIYIRPPVRETPSPKLLAVLAPITMDRLHSMGNELTWERNYFKKIIKGWKDKGVQVMYRGYMFNLAEPGLPFSLVPQVASEFKYFHDIGIERARVETTPAWAYHGPGLYLAAKMLWNPGLDVEATMNDYYEKFYGPAAEHMKAHFKLLEETFETADYYAGSLNDFHKILNVEIMKKLEEYLQKAEKSVQSDSVYAKRVNMIRISFDFGDNFLEMLEANRNFDFVTAKEKLDEVRVISLKAISHSPVILYPHTQYYINRFWGERITDGYQRVIEGNKIVAKLPDEWRAMLDISGGGEALGLWKDGAGMESMMTLKTSESMSTQGLRYYNGDIWYRARVTVPKVEDNKEVRLWIGGIDEKAKVWVNGKELKILKSGTKAIEKSWEFDATNEIKYDQENLVTVKVENRMVDELGMGGIVGPAMFWSVEKEPDTTAPTKPENLRVEAISDSEIKLRWEASTDASGIAEYRIFQGKTFIGTTDSKTLSYTVSGLNPKTNYSYTVKAVDLYGILLSADSNKVDVTKKESATEPTPPPTTTPMPSDGDAGSGTTQPTIPAGDGSVQVNYTVSGNTASLFLPDSKVNEIIAKSKDGEAVLDLSKEENATAAELPKSALLSMAGAGLDVTFKLPNGTFTLDEDSAASIANQASGTYLKIELKKLEASALTAEQNKGVKENDIVFDINIFSNNSKITNFDGKLFIKVPYSGPQPVAVWYLNDKGELEILSCTFSNGTVSFTLDHLSLYVIGQNTMELPWENPFADVKTDDWFYNAVKYVNEKGMMIGTSVTTFAPSANTTRGMIVAILYKMEGAPVVSGNPFDDVAASQYYTDAVTWAAENKIVAGYGNGKFGPNDSITREQMATILMNYVRFKGYDVSARTDLTKFSDNGSISSFAVDALSWTNAEKLIIGKGNGILDPKGYATRVEVASILMNYVEKIVKP